jgi:hypothetical protein
MATKKKGTTKSAARKTGKAVKAGAKKAGARKVKSAATGKKKRTTSKSRK